MGSRKRLANPENPRWIAANVVEAVLFRGAWIAADLSRTLDELPLLDTRDRALATELVYGVVRTRGALEMRLLEHAPRGIGDQKVLCHLLVAAYQILLLDRVPSFAAVHEAVELISLVRGARVGKFANALLRKLARQPKLDRPSAVRESVPSWLLRELERAVGLGSAEALLGIGAEESLSWMAMTARFREGEPLPEWALAAEPGRFSERIRRVRRAGDIRRMSEYAAGRFVVQEEGAYLCGLAVGAQPGERVLDACAGRGQKSSLLAEQVGVEGELWVTDVNARKLQQLAEEFRRLELQPPSQQVVDWSRQDARLGTEQDVPRFDRVLVDAPCSGTGTLRRRPEIALRLTEGDVERLAQQSARILENSARFARPGAAVVFCVCSVLARECEEVVRQVDPALLRPAPLFPASLEPITGGSSTSFRLDPCEHGTDGFFVACFERC